MTELLAPAGDLERLKIAFLYGADACYIGGKKYSLRANAKNFTLEEMKIASEYASKLNKKIYVTINIFFHDSDIEGLEEYLKYLDSINIFGVIVSDILVVELINKLKLNLFVVLSTQSSVLNYEAVNFWKSLGVKRIVVARETSREDIIRIIKETNIEVECFVHGAMCTSISGKCVMSNYLTNRDANRGGCAQPCRWLYTTSNKEDFSMMSKDLNMVEYLKDMIDIGITSLKIEGRMRSNYYIATVVSTYREAIDNYYNNTLTEEKIAYYKKVLNRVANRESISQFYNNFPGVEGQYFLGRQEISNQDFLGVVLDYDDDNHIVTLVQKNYFKPKDKVSMFGPSIETFDFEIPNIYDRDNNKLEVARHPEEIIKFKLDKKVYKDDIMRVKLD